MQNVPNRWDIIILTQDGRGDIRCLASAFGVLAYGTRTQATALFGVGAVVPV